MSFACRHVHMFEWLCKRLCIINLYGMARTTWNAFYTALNDTLSEVSVCAQGTPEHKLFFHVFFAGRAARQRKSRVQKYARHPLARFRKHCLIIDDSRVFRCSKLKRVESEKNATQNQIGTCVASRRHCTVRVWLLQWMFADYDLLWHLPRLFSCQYDT